MSTLTEARPFSLDDVLDFLTELDAEPQLPCDWGCDRPAKWQVKYDPCNHSHIICDRHKQYVEQRQLEADGTAPYYRPYASVHLCCGQTIWRATWRRL